MMAVEGGGKWWGRSLATRACGQQGVRLRVTGTGTEAPKLRQVWDLWSPPIRATADVAWTTLTDISRIPEDMPIVVEVVPEPGPIQMGSRFRQTTWVGSYCTSSMSVKSQHSILLADSV